MRLYASKPKDLNGAFCGAYKSYQTIVKIMDDGCVFESRRWVRNDNNIEVDNWMPSPKLANHDLLVAFGYTELKPVNKHLEKLKAYESSIGGVKL